MVHQCAYAMCICFAVSYFVWKAASGSFVPYEETYGIEKKEKLRSKLPMLLSALQLESDWVLTTFDGRAHLTDSASADSYRSVRVFRNSDEKLRVGLPRPPSFTRRLRTISSVSSEVPPLPVRM